MNGHCKADPKIVDVIYGWSFINFARSVSFPDCLHCEVHDNACLVFESKYIFMTTGTHNKHSPSDVSLPLVPNQGTDEDHWK